MAADTLCVCPMATWLWVCRSVIIIIISTDTCTCMLACEKCNGALAQHSNHILIPLLISASFHLNAHSGLSRRPACEAKRKEKN